MSYLLNLSPEEENLLKEYMDKHQLTYKAEACRQLMVIGFLSELKQEHLDMISHVVKSELEAELKLHNKRIKSILNNAMRMALTTTYFLISVLNNLIDDDKRKNVTLLYEEATKFATKEIKRKVNDNE